MSSVALVGLEQKTNKSLLIAFCMQILYIWALFTKRWEKVTKTVLSTEPPKKQDMNTPKAARKYIYGCQKEQELKIIFLTVYNGGKGPGRRHRNKPRLALHTGHTVLTLFMQMGTQVQVTVLLLA
jgi:hypothetical protein